MSREILLQTLKKFECDFVVDESTSEEINKKEELHTIINDVNRSDFRLSKLSKSSLADKLYVFILVKVFKDLELPYYQGMMDVGIVLVDVYFQDKASSFISKHKDLDTKAKPQTKFDEIEEDERKLFEKFVEENADLYKRFKNALTNILYKYVLFFFKNELKNCKELGKVFSKMMKEKFKVSVEEQWWMRYLGHIITLFMRTSENNEVVYKLYNLIFNSDPEIMFSILAVYFDKATEYNKEKMYIDEKNKERCMITSVDDKDIEKIMDTHEIFLECKRKIKM
jgi:hypothetical protein